MKKYDLVDLHIHTTHSDGSDNVIMLKNNLIKNKNKVLISITDHDSVNAYFDNEINNYYKNNIDIVPGCEFSFSYNGNFRDMLGYFIDVNKAKSYLEKQYTINFKIQKEQKILQDFQKLCDKYDVIYDKNITITTGNKSEAYIKMMQSIRCVPENVERYDVLDPKKSFYFKCFTNPKSNFYVNVTEGIPSMQEVVNVIHDCGGLAFLAHPYEYNETDEEVGRFINLAISAGINGIEVYHSANSVNQRKTLTEIANNNNLFISGGSDYHGINKRNVKLFYAKDDVLVKQEYINPWIIKNLSKLDCNNNK